MHKKIIIIGAGLYGAVMARQFADWGNEVTVFEKEHYVGGMCYTKNIDGINCHMFGPHIFHTSNDKVWSFVNRFAKWRPFINCPLAVTDYLPERYNLPFNMNTFQSLWGTTTPQEAIEQIRKATKLYNWQQPKNAKEKALSMVGAELYRLFIKGYTKKQWGRDPDQLPPEIISRIPIRFNYDNRYFTDKYQAVPVGGYTQFINRILADKNINVVLKDKITLDPKYQVKDGIEYEDGTNFDLMVISAPLDEFFNYRFGSLDWRSLKFETKSLNTSNYQGNAVINYTGESIPFTRIIEHKFFENPDAKNTVITFEYPQKWSKGKPRYYPINDDRNNSLYRRYREYAEKVAGNSDLIIGGRLGSYKYLNMDQVIEQALKDSSSYLKKVYKNESH